ncbi:MAG: FAD-binding protein [Candidatus Limiplasma sp.]|nr:FAD-binding protein [Candidatus Limiplasma sp.]
MDFENLPFLRYNTIIVGSGAAGLNAALRLYEMGQREIAIVTESALRAL